MSLIGDTRHETTDQLGKHTLFNILSKKHRLRCDPFDRACHKCRRRTQSTEAGGGSDKKKYYSILYWIPEQECLNADFMHM